MPHVLVTWKSDDEGWLKLQNTQKVQAYLQFKSEEFIEVAKGVFVSRNLGESEFPEFYINSFGVRNIRHLGLRGKQVYNSDRTAMWVEFGAHAGGKTRILKYRVFGLAMDIMEARAIGRRRF